MACYSWEDLPLEILNPFSSRRTFKGDKIKVLLLTLKPSYIGEKHEHQSEQISHILKGRIKLKLGEEEWIVQTGNFIHIAENQPHQIESVEEETVMLSVFSPAEY